MWRPEPPGLVWLLAHELRIGWRTIGAISSRIMAVLGVLLLAAAHLAGWGLMRSPALDRGLQSAPAVVILFTAVVAMLVLATAFRIAVHALFERGDLDLLLASPVPVIHVYAIRGLAVALGSVATLAIFILPVANMGPFAGKWGSLAAYPMLAAVGLASAGIALAATLTLVRAMGVRRAKIAAQILGAVVGAALLMASQVQGVLSSATRNAISEWTRTEPVAWWLGASSPMTWPLRGMLGEAFPALTIVAGGVLIFAIVIALTWRSFASSTRESPALSGPTKASDADARRRFSGSTAAIVVRKELLLIGRDHMLIARSLLQVLYLIPLFLILLRKAQPPAMIAAVLVLLASSLAASLAWMTVSGEEAPDLLDSSPVAAERLRWLKALAALIPVAVLVIPFLGWYAVMLPSALPALLPCLVAAIASSAVVQVWTGKPGSPRDLRGKPRQGLLVTLAETFSSLGWAAACFFALSDMASPLWGVPVGLFAPVIAWFSARRARIAA